MYRTNNVIDYIIHAKLHLSLSITHINSSATAHAHNVIIHIHFPIFHIHRISRNQAES